MAAKKNQEKVSDQWYCPGCGKPIPKRNVEMSGDGKTVSYGCSCHDTADFSIYAEEYIWTKTHSEEEDEEEEGE